MGKADLRAMTEKLLHDCAWSKPKDLGFTIEAALTAANDAGDKAGYERGWDEGVEAAAAMTPLNIPGEREAILSLMKGQGV